MAFAISIQADGSSPVMEALTKLAGLDTTAMFDEIGAEMVKSTQDRFRYQHDVDGNPWKQSWRAKIDGGETGRDRGFLLNGLNHQLRPNGVEWGSDQSYAHVFHFGAHIYPRTAEYLVFAVRGQIRKVKEVNIPSRTFLGINAEDEQKILNIIGRHIGV